jgi:acetyl esterase
VSLSWGHYLGDRETTDDALQYAAPARAVDLAGLPPACVVVAQFDPLRDEGIAYAQRLAQAGVATELHLYPATFHGSAMLDRADVSRRMAADKVGALRRGLRVADGNGPDQAPAGAATSSGTRQP